MAAQGVALVASVVIPTSVVDQVVALLENVVALLVATSEVHGGKRFPALWVMVLLCGCALGVGWRLVGVFWLPQQFLLLFG